MTKLLAVATSADPGNVSAFFSACDLAGGLIGSEAVAACWNLDSVVEGFTTGGLAAHLYSAIRLFESALEKPEPSTSRAGGFVEFYALNRIGERMELEDAVQRSIRADAAKRAELGAAVVSGKFDSLVARLRDNLPDQPMNRLVPVWRIEGGVTHLSDYLLTRIVELVVHADDLACSVGVDIVLPGEAASLAFGVFLDLARARSGDLALLRAFTRRERGDAEVLRVL
ncbi:MAG: maleylpyruvate isomerase N-terminal domain-containing protein [Acidimicrobiales bacterium]